MIGRKTLEKDTTACFLQAALLVKYQAFGVAYLRRGESQFYVMFS